MNRNKKLQLGYFFITISLIALFVSCIEEKNQVSEKEGQNNNYTERRPIYHFTPNNNWVNDPNGLVFFNDEYHLFFQHHPHSNKWGPMHWGHAISRDLISWEEYPIALYPDSLGYIFSGSAAVDRNNTSGFAEKEQTPLVAMFTYHDMDKFKADEEVYQSQGIAYSLDEGRNWEKYKHNPIIKNPGVKDFRDPKIFWHDESKKWISLIASKDHIKFYASDNLTDWTKISEFGRGEGMHGKGVWECPDLFPLKVEGEETQKWVLIQNINEEHPNGGSGTQYFIGDFDGVHFKNENNPETVLWLDYGKDNFAGITWNGIEDRRVFIGWMSNWLYAQDVPTETWRNGMTFPRELTLKNTDIGLRLATVPIDEIQLLRNDKVQFSNIDIDKEFNSDKKIPFSINSSELKGEFVLDESTEFTLELYNDIDEKIVIGFSSKSNEFFIDRSNTKISSFSDKFNVKQVAPRISKSLKLPFQILVDTNSIEVFFDNGETVLTSLYFSKNEIEKFVIKKDNGVLKISELEVNQLKLNKEQ